MSALGASRTRVLGTLLAEGAARGGGRRPGRGAVARGLLATMLASAPGQHADAVGGVVGLDWRAFGFAAGLAAATCLVVSALPALRVGRLDLVDALKGGARSVAGDARERWHRCMMVTQLALVLVLLVTSGLLLRSFTRLVAVSPGFEVGGLVVAQMQFPSERYRTRDRLQLMAGARRSGWIAAPGMQRRHHSRTAHRRWRRLPGDGCAPEAEGQTPRDIAVARAARARPSSPSYFATLGVPIVAGRTFLPAEGEAVVVNTVVARRFWGGRSPIGQRFRVDASWRWMTVVGVAGDVKQMGPDDPMGEGMELYQLHPSHSGRHPHADRSGVGRRPPP